MHTETATVTVLESAKEAKQFLLNAGVQGPSLHPRVNSESTRDRWNGWNKAVATGLDGNGMPVILAAHHYASGWHSFSGSFGDETGRLGKIDFAFAEIKWPVRVFPVVPYIKHPEYTP